MRALAARIDDWLNPIAVKELRQAVRGKFVMVALMLSLLAQLLTVAGMAVANALGNGPQAAGPTTFTVIYSVVFTAAIFFVPMYTGFRMAAERSDANVDLLFITTIRPRTIVLGKVQAVVGIVALIFASSLPFMMFSYALRGVDFVTIAVLVAMAILVVISHSITALFVGALPASRPFKILLALGFFMSTIAVYAPVLGFASQLLRFGTGMMLSKTGFWLGVAASVVGMVAANAVLLVLTTAMITPAAANRALPIRIMFLAVWLLSFGTAFWTAIAGSSGELLTFWAIMQLSLITIVLLSASSERETWGARVTRTIPRNPLLRALAFLFYSGSAGGTIWAALMYTATIAAFWFAAVVPKLLTRTKASALVEFFIDAALAMVAYAMTAVFLRRTLLKRVPISRTWGLALALFILLTVLPPLAILSVDAETINWNTYVHVTTIANPFPTLTRPHELQLARTIFLAVWAALALAANATWFKSQVRQFKPLDRTPRQPGNPTASQPLQTGLAAE